MRAGLRLTTILLAGGLWLVPAPALAQNTTEPPVTNSPAPDTVGPRELQNFSLPGTATRPGNPAAPATTAPREQAAPPTSQAPEPTPARRTVQTRHVSRAESTATTAPPGAAAPVPTAPPPSVGSAAAPTPPAPAPSVTTSTAAPTLPPERKLLLWPWLIAAAALAAGTAFLLWRRRSREAFAGSQFDLLVSQEPEPVSLPPVPLPPRPEPPPRTTSAPLPPRPAPPKPAPAPSGIVAARLRPSLEILFQPTRCLVEDERVTIEFELELFNAGSAPARAVLAEATLLNAGETQEQELSTFFANPVGAGERVEMIAPMKRMAFTSQVVAPRAAVQEYELAGRKAFVPVIAFNAIYQWSGGEAQTSAAFLVGRDTQRDKLGPLRLDHGAREFHGLAARALPTELRT
ncbi:MAG: hypothetical protein ACJ8FT_10375 [Sphingomonas sp.]